MQAGYGKTALGIRKTTHSFPSSLILINKHLPRRFVTGELSSICSACSSLTTWYRPQAMMLLSFGQVDIEHAEYSVSTKSIEGACMALLMMVLA
jgi:hypothetical protein